MTGVMVGPLREAHSDRIVVGDRTVYLADGQRCDHPVGARVHVVYEESDGRREVRLIERAL